MAELVSIAWGVNLSVVVGGPSWLEIPRYDVIAKAPPKSTTEALRPALQELLAERFKLAARKDTRQVPAFALTAGKRPALKRSEGEGLPKCEPKFPEPGQGAPTLTYTCTHMTMTAFAESFPRLIGASQYINESPVADRTELKDAWDFNFK